MVETVAINSDREDKAQTPNESVAPAPLGGVLTRMQVHEPSFTPIERRIAASLRTNGRDLVGLSIEEMADRVGVSTASVVRFCRRLGYRGLRELSLAFAAEVLGDSSVVTPPISPGDSLNAIVRKVLSAAQQALAASAEVLDEDALARAIEVLTNATRVQLFGVGGSAAIAQDAHYRFARVGLPVAVLTDAQLQPIVAARLKPEDVAFVISHTGRSVEPVHVLEEAKLVGATTILLTSFANTPAAQWADIVLLTAPVATAPWDGMAPLRVAQLSVIDMICVAVTGRDDSDRRDFRARYDAMLDRHMLPSGVGPISAPGPRDARSASERQASMPFAVASNRPATRATPDPRRVVIEGVQNTRHLGGFHLPDGGLTAPIVLRSGMLAQMTPGGITQVQELGVTAIVDLRRDEDCLDYPTPGLASAGIEIIRAPMYVHPRVSAPDLDDRSGWIASYHSWVESSQSAMRILIETIHETNGSVLMHCNLGEDRTGIATALLLDLLGVEEDEIVEDYRRSPNGPGWEFLIPAMLERVRQRWGSTAAYFVDAGTGKLVLSRARARIEGRHVA